ncbi:MAG: hypothetical protein DRJ65_13890 [Acidobacteria bacterium]|nr:MAG: hypothetical protein DRJ65_13890 [Acidobacteriota bacterium]
MHFTYPDIKRAIISKFPVLDQAVSDLELEWYPDSPGPYTLVGQVFVPFINLLLERPRLNGRDSALFHVFALVKDFLRETDPEIANMIYVEPYLSRWVRLMEIPHAGLRARARPEGRAYIELP